MIFPHESTHTCQTRLSQLTVAWTFKNKMKLNKKRGETPKNNNPNQKQCPRNQTKIPTNPHFEKVIVGGLFVHTLFPLRTVNRNVNRNIKKFPSSWDCHKQWEIIFTLQWFFFFSLKETEYRQAHWDAAQNTDVLLIPQKLRKQNGCCTTQL